MVKPTTPRKNALTTGNVAVMMLSKSKFQAYNNRPLFLASLAGDFLAAFISLPA
jgi:hypothetical protein